jgi:hypothetical protein
MLLPKSNNGRLKQRSRGSFQTAKDSGQIPESARFDRNRFRVRMKISANRAADSTPAAL